MAASGGSGSDPPRQPRDLQGLLRLCMESADYEGPPAGSSAMDPDRRQWLDQALTGMTTNVAEVMSTCTSTIKKVLDSQSPTQCPEEKLDELDSAVDTLIDYTGSLDYAQDFHKIGGFDIIRPMLEYSNTRVQTKGCELLAELVQNHRYCQTVAIEMKLLATLIHLLDFGEDEVIRVKSLYAISCLVRDNEEAEAVFETEYDGFSVLLRAMQSQTTGENKLRTKSAFLMASLFQQGNNSSRDALSKMGIVDQLVALLHSEHDPSHEYLVSALHALVAQHQPSLTECLRPELQLHSLLQTRIEQLKGHSEFSEEEELCEKLLQLCFSDNDLPESER